MTIEEALKSSGLPRLDAEVLLAHLLKKPREWLIAHGTEEFTHPEWDSVIQRRKNNEPVAYITGVQEFYGRDFIVDNNVLIPRPSTERLIDLLFDVLKDKEECIRQLDTDVIGMVQLYESLDDVHTIADVCTGSGCIAVTLACETNYSITATDISRDALAVATRNAEMHNVTNRIELLEGNLLEPLHNLEQPFLIISNPPYIAEGTELMPDVAQYEPHLALFGGSDGNTFVNQILSSAKKMPNCRGVIIECGKQ